MNSKFIPIHTGIRRGMAGACVLIATLLTIPAASAANDEGHNQLQAITATRLAGDRVQLQLKLSDSTSQPLAFTVSQPARIALDLADTRLALKERKTDIDVGDVSSVVAAEAGARTRVVINLTALVPYNMSVEGNTVYILLGGNPSDTAVAQLNPASLSTMIAATAPVPAATNSASPAPAAPAPGLTKVDFRRGPDGTGQVVVDLSNPAIVGSVHSEGNNVVVDFANAQLPKDLVRRMDVSDFATPVQYIDAQNTPSGARLVIHPTGQYEKLAYQSDGLFSVEFKPVEIGRASCRERV